MSEQIENPYRIGPPSEQDVSVPRAAELLGVKPTTMHALIDEGKVKSFTPRKQRRVKVSEILRYRRRCEQRGRVYAEPLQAEW